MNKEERGAQQRGLVRLPMMVAWALGAPTLWLPASRFPGPLDLLPYPNWGLRPSRSLHLPINVLIPSVIVQPFTQ